MALGTFTLRQLWIVPATAHVSVALDLSGNTRPVEAQMDTDMLKGIAEVEHRGDFISLFKGYMTHIAIFRRRTI
jgi:hypothetical protein